MSGLNAPDQQIGAVLEFPGGFQHATAGGRGRLPLAAEDARDRGDRQPRVARDDLERDGAFRSLESLN